MLSVLVGVDQRAEPMVVEHFPQQAFVERAIDDMHTRNAAVAGEQGVPRL